MFKKSVFKSCELLKKLGTIEENNIFIVSGRLKEEIDKISIFLNIFVY